MFDLEDAIGQWRREMILGGIESPEMLEELEGHLRDDIDARVEAAGEAEQAFAAAARQIGKARALGTEFRKVGGMKEARRRMKQAFLTLAGIPAQYSPSPMFTTSSNSDPEPRWVTYLKASAFVLPAACAWIFSSVFLFPKLQQICMNAGLALPRVYHLTQFVVAHNLLIGAGFLLLLVLLEWRSLKWPHYRRAAISVGVFLVNTSVLVLITLMVLFALLAAPNLIHPV